MQFILGILFLFFANISAAPQTVLLIRHDAKDKKAFFKQIAPKKINWLIPISKTGAKESYNLRRFLDTYFRAKGITSAAQYAEKVDVYVSPFRRTLQTSICWANTHGINMKVDKAFGEIKKNWKEFPIWHDRSEPGRMKIDEVPNGCEGGKQDSLLPETSNGPLCDAKIAKTLVDCGIGNIPQEFATSTAVIPGISTDYYNTDTKDYFKTGKETDYATRVEAAYNVIQNSEKQFVVVFAHGSFNIAMFREFAKHSRDEPHIRINPARVERAMPTATITFLEKKNDAWKWDGERFPIKFGDGNDGSNDGKEFARLGQAPCPQPTIVDDPEVQHVGIDTTIVTDPKLPPSSIPLATARLTYFDATSNAGILSFTGTDNGICKYDFKCTSDDKKTCYVTGYVGSWAVCKAGGSFVGVHYLNDGKIMSGYDPEALKSTLTGIESLTPPTDCPSPATSEKHMEVKISNQKPTSEWIIPCMVLLGLMLIFLAFANLFGHAGSTLEIELLDVDQHLIA